MPALNKVLLIGYLGRDPELRYTPEGVPVASFSLAVQETQEERAIEWFNIVAWRRMAELCDKMLHKGEYVYVEGQLHTRGWKDEDGQRHFRSEVIATDLIPLEAGSQESLRQSAYGLVDGSDVS